MTVSVFYFLQILKEHINKHFLNKLKILINLQRVNMEPGGRERIQQLTEVQTEQTTQYSMSHEVHRMTVTHNLTRPESP